MELHEISAWLRGVETAGARIAKAAAPDILAEAQRTAAAGTTPEGEAWELTKKGERALKNAASHLSVQAVGDVVVLTLKGPDVYHNKTRRILIRRGRVPQRYYDILRKHAIEAVKP